VIGQSFLLNRAVGKPSGEINQTISRSTAAPRGEFQSRCSAYASRLSVMLLENLKPNSGEAF